MCACVNNDRGTSTLTIGHDVHVNVNVRAHRICVNGAHASVTSLTPASNRIYAGFDCEHTHVNCCNARLFCCFYCCLLLFLLSLSHNLSPSLKMLSDNSTCEFAHMQTQLSRCMNPWQEQERQREIKCVFILEVIRI